MAFRTTRRKQPVVHVLYNPPEILANSVIRAIAVSVTYRKHDKAKNPGSIPVSATNSSYTYSPRVTTSDNALARRTGSTSTSGAPLTPSLGNSQCFE